MVQFSDEAYRRLRQDKRPGESFSDVVLRRFPTGSLEKIWGVLSKGEGDAAQAVVDDIDAYSDAKMDRELSDRGLL